MLQKSKVYCTILNTAASHVHVLYQVTNVCHSGIWSKTILSFQQLQSADVFRIMLFIVIPCVCLHLYYGDLATAVATVTHLLFAIILTALKFHIHRYFK